MEHDQLIISTALNAWHGAISRTQQLLHNLPEERLLQEVAPGKNRGIYVLGHLIAYHDALCTILDLGSRLHPELDGAFLHHPDKSGLLLPTITELKQYWEEVHERLARDFQQLPVSAWFSRHTAVSAEDFLVNPSRNKFNVLLSRTSHLAYHTGQLVLLK
jgi:hypothetical protein